MKTTYTFKGDVTLTVERVYPDLSEDERPSPFESMLADLVGTLKKQAATSEADSSEAKSA